MKKSLLSKSLLSLCGATLLVLGACTGSDSAKSEISEENKALGDSVSVALGRLAGLTERDNFERMKARMTEQQLDNYSRDEFLRGVKTVLETDSTNVAFISGLQAGMQLFGPVKTAEQMTGVPVDYEIVYRNFKEIYMADSVADPMAIRTEYQKLMTRMQEKFQEKREADMANTPEAQANLQAGQEYIDKCLKDGYKKSASGLVYKILKPGEGPKVTATDRIKLQYVGTSVDGQEFDKSPEGGIDATANRFVPGFTEGLELLAKGGSAIIVLPPSLAYGVEGRAPTIGPNQTLVFQISVDDILAD